MDSALSRGSGASSPIGAFNSFRDLECCISAAQDALAQIVETMVDVANGILGKIPRKPELQRAPQSIQTMKLVEHSEGKRLAELSQANPAVAARERGLPIVVRAEPVPMRCDQCVGGVRHVQLKLLRKVLAEIR